MNNESASETRRTSEPADWRQTERDLARMQGEIGAKIGERVAKLEEGAKSLATKADLERAKLAIYGSFAAAGLSILILLLRFVSWIWPSMPPAD